MSERRVRVTVYRLDVLKLYAPAQRSLDDLAEKLSTLAEVPLEKLKPEVLRAKKIILTSLAGEEMEVHQAAVNPEGDTVLDIFIVYDSEWIGRMGVLSE